MERTTTTFLTGLLSFGLCVGLQIGGASSAFADGRIGAGVKIPLDTAKAERKGALKQLINSCFYSETLVSLLPDLVNVQPATGTSPTIVEGGDVEQDRQGDEKAWTTTQHYYPKKSVEMEFTEAGSSGNSVVRRLVLDANASAGWGADQTTNMHASVDTDAGGEEVTVELSIQGALPYLEVLGKGSQVCGSNNWGRTGCHDTPMTVDEVNLVIPATFVADGVWTNDATNIETKKSFDFFKYAECLLSKYEAN